MQVEKKKKNDGYSTVHNVNKSQGKNYVLILLFFYFHLAKNILFQIFSGIKQNKITLETARSCPRPFIEVAVEKGFYYSV